MRLRNRSNLVLLSTLMNPSAAFLTDGTYFKITNPDSICALWKYNAASICSDFIFVDGLWASDMTAELSARKIINSRIIESRSSCTN